LTALLFIVLALVGMPLFIVLGAAALTATREAQLDPALLMVEFARLAASPNLVAIPLFVLAGATLGRGGGAAPGALLQRALGLDAGRNRLGHDGNVHALHRLLRRVGGDHSGARRAAVSHAETRALPEKFALGLVTSAGSMGLLLPPSLAVLLYGVVAQVSIGDLFVAGLLPTLLLFLMVGAMPSCGARAGHPAINSVCANSPLPRVQAGPISCCRLA